MISYAKDKKKGLAFFFLILFMVIKSIPSELKRWFKIRIDEEHNMGIINYKNPYFFFFILY
jgi:hypothetical protein